MRMFDALHRARRPGGPLKNQMWASALVVASLGAATPAVLRGPSFFARPQSGSFLVEVMQDNAPGKSLKPLRVGEEAILRFSKEIKEVTSVIGGFFAVEATRGAELRLRGLAAGRATLTITYIDGSVEQLAIEVQRDLSFLKAQLATIHADIKVDRAPDTEAIVLSGLVDTLSQAERAGEVAREYLKDLRVINLLRVRDGSQTLEGRIRDELTVVGVADARVRQLSGQGASELVAIIEGRVKDLAQLETAFRVASGILGDKARIVNMIVVEDRPAAIEQAIEKAIHAQVGATKVRVSRLSGEADFGAGDILVLNGTVPDQTSLARTLTLAAKMHAQLDLARRKREGEIERITETLDGGGTRITERPLRLDDVLEDIKVVADESGALAIEQSSNQGNALGAILGQSGSGSNNQAKLLQSELGSNLARAKVVELAGGRVISFLEVDDLPQVRVSIRIYEVNRTALLTWGSDVKKLQYADFDSNGINPNSFATDAEGNIVTNANGEPVLGSGGADAAGILSFLEGGFGSTMQLGGGRLGLDWAFNLLETEGIARALTTPTLTVLSGEVAAVGDGGSVAINSSITTPVGANTNGVGVFSTVQDKEFGISLAVRPLVDEKGYVTLTVVPSVSNPDFELTTTVRETTGSDQGTVAFNKQSLKTTTRLRDGQSLLVGGLVKQRRSDDSGQTPWLHQVPLVGGLFQDKSYSDSDRELVFVVTPVIVRDQPTKPLVWEHQRVEELVPFAPPAAQTASKKED
jgi:Flp pilus assembly secretin CpaC